MSTLSREAPVAATSPTSTGGPVPLATVLPLAVPVALVSVFWIVALRTSLGSIARSSSFGGFLREAVLVMPFYVLAVLAALELVRWRVRRTLSGAVEVAAAGALVAAAAAVPALVELVVSSAYDYRLQSAELTTMAGMSENCDAACHAAARHAGLALQERSVVVGGIVLLAASVVLVAWVLALRGWRLPLTSQRPRARVLPRVAVRPLEVTVAIALVGSAAIHTAVVPEHLAEWPAAGAFFVLLAAAELVLALALLLGRGPGGRALLVTIGVVSLGPLLLWAVSRTTGLPFGPGAGSPEPTGLADVCACVLEVAALGLLALVWSRPARGTARSRTGPATRLIAVLLIGVTTLGLGGTGVPWLDLRADPVTSSHAHG